LTKLQLNAVVAKLRGVRQLLKKSAASARPLPGRPNRARPRQMLWRSRADLG
jgi:hypothetical protein